MIFKTLQVNNMKNRKSKISSIALIFSIYLLTFILVYFLFPIIPFDNTIIKVFSADILATFVVFIFSFAFNNSSIYDPYWSVIPPFIVVYLIQLFPDGNSVRQFIILILVFFWSIRLTINWLRSWQGLKHEDWRYISIAQKTGKLYWPVSFLGIHLMPTIFVFLGCLPLWFSLSNSTPFNFYDLIATVFTFCAILTEWISDEQLFRFRKLRQENSNMESGLWAISRHPNYLGEINFWIGIFLFVLSSSKFSGLNGLWTGIGFIAMILLFNFISIPMMEKRNLIRKSDYEEYMRKVPALIPRLFTKQ